MGHLFLRREEPWRRGFNAAVSKLRALPDTTDKWSARKPADPIFDLVQKIASRITRSDLPIPMVAAGSDGTIQIKWQRDQQSEISLFVEPSIIEYLLVQKGKVSDGELSLDQIGRINDFIEQVFD